MHATCNVFLDADCLESLDGRFPLQVTQTSGRWSSRGVWDCGMVIESKSSHKNREHNKGLFDIVKEQTKSFVVILTQEPVLQEPFSIFTFGFGRVMACVLPPSHDAATAAFSPILVSLVLASC